MMSAVPDLRNKAGAFNSRFNATVLSLQETVGGWYEKYFTMHAALLFSLTAGACMGFTGDDCHGKIPFDSPVFYCLALIAAFFLFQTFLLIQLTGGRLVRLLTVAICGHYLAYQSYGFWSMYEHEQVVASLKPVTSDNISLIADSCKPYAYANIPYGHFWILGPAVIIIAICFFVGNRQTEAEN